MNLFAWPDRRARAFSRQKSSYTVNSAFISHFVSIHFDLFRWIFFLFCVFQQLRCQTDFTVWARSEHVTSWESIWRSVFNFGCVVFFFIHFSISFRMLTEFSRSAMAMKGVNSVPNRNNRWNRIEFFLMLLIKQLGGRKFVIQSNRWMNRQNIGYVEWNFGCSFLVGYL